MRRHSSRLPSLCFFGIALLCFLGTAPEVDAKKNKKKASKDGHKKVKGQSAVRRDYIAPSFISVAYDAAPLVYPLNTYVLQSSNFKYFLLFQSDGNLVLYMTPFADGSLSPNIYYWTSGSYGASTTSLVLSNYQGLSGPGTNLADPAAGMLAVYNSRQQPIWWTSSCMKYTNVGYSLVLQDSGNLELYWTSSTTNPTFRPEQRCWQSGTPRAESFAPTFITLPPGGEYTFSPSSTPLLQSHNLMFVLWFQTDGNLVLYAASNNGALTPRSAIWATNKFTSTFKMQKDGNLVQYYGNGGAPWASGPLDSNNRMHTLVLRDNGNLELYFGATNTLSNLVWQTNTPGAATNAFPYCSGGWVETWTCY